MPPRLALCLESAPSIRASSSLLEPAASDGAASVVRCYIAASTAETARKPPLHGLLESLLTRGDQAAAVSLDHRAVERFRLTAVAGACRTERQLLPIPDVDFRQTRISATTPKPT